MYFSVVVGNNVCKIFFIFKLWTWIAQSTCWTYFSPWLSLHNFFFSSFCCAGILGERPNPTPPPPPLHKNNDPSLSVGTFCTHHIAFPPEHVISSKSASKGGYRFGNSKDIKKSFPPSKWRTRISSSFSSPEFMALADSLSTYTVRRTSLVPPAMTGNKDCKTTQKQDNDNSLPFESC